MPSEAQTAANRRNALKSTGPKTAEGKAKVAQNALRHGLTAKHVVCFDEKPQNFAAYYEALRRSFDPADEVEEHLVERIALCAWRLRRMSRIEARLIDSYEGTDIRVYGTQLATLIDRAPYGLSSLSRYEAALDRALQRAQLMLERRQARRRGESVPAPIAVDVNGIDETKAIESAPAEDESHKTKPILAAEPRAVPELTPHPDPPPSRGEGSGVGDGSGSVRVVGRSAEALQMRRLAAGPAP